MSAGPPFTLISTIRKIFCSVGFDELQASLQARQREALTGERSVDERVFGFRHELLAHVNEHRDLFQAMVGKRSGAVVQNAMHKLLIDLVKADLKPMIVRAVLT